MKKTMLVLLAVMLIAATGCTPDSAGHAGGRFNMSLAGDPENLNPIIHTDTSSSDITKLMYEGLMRYNKDMELEGLLAEDWKFSDDYLTITFYLKEDVKWHDGVDFTAEDVVFTFDTVMHPEYPGARASMFASIEKVEALDEHTVQFTLKEQFGPVMNNLSFRIIPKHIFSVYPEGHPKAGEEYPVADLREHPNNTDNIVGTGPYKWDRWETGQHIVLTKNENYHDEGPYFDELVFHIYGDFEAVMMAMEVGRELDYATIQSNKVKDIEKKGPEGDGTYNLETYDGLSYSYLGMNFGKEKFSSGIDNPFNDLKVRQAFAHAVPYDMLIDNVQDGRGYRLHSNVPRSSWAYSEEGLTTYDYDPDKAAELLEEAGWTLKEGQEYRTNEKGQIFEFELSTNIESQPRVDIVTILQEEFRKVGVKANIRTMEWNAYIKHVNEDKTAEMYLLGWSLAGDPDAYNTFHSEATNNLNYTSYANDEADYWIEQGRYTLDMEKRKEAYAELAKVLSEDLPYIFLFAPENVDAIRSNIVGYEVGQTGLFEFEKWHYDADALSNQ